MKSFPCDHPSRTLWGELGDVEPYPAGVTAVPEQIPGTSFFPGGTGLWCEGSPKVPHVPIGGVMVLGHDFHSVAGYEWARTNVAENLRSPTWRHLLFLLKSVSIAPETCFSTNVYMGLRDGPATTGRFPGSRDAAYVKRCRDFLLRQLRFQRPAVVLTLGAFVPPFVAPLSPELSSWAACRSLRELDAARLSMIPAASFPAACHVCAIVALTHPCLRPANVGHRTWQSLHGDPAEFEMVRQALDSAPRGRRA